MKFLSSLIRNFMTLNSKPSTRLASHVRDQVDALIQPPLTGLDLIKASNTFLEFVGHTSDGERWEIRVVSSFHGPTVKVVSNSDSAMQQMIAQSLTLKIKSLDLSRSCLR